MPLLLTFWRSINRKARVVVSEGIRLMAWTADDEKLLSVILEILAISYGREGSKINPIFRDLVGTGF